MKRKEAKGSYRKQYELAKEKKGGIIKSKKRK